HKLGLDGFLNAHLLTGDERYIDVWRRMIDKINAHAKVMDSKKVYPHMYGDQGWYNFTPEPYAQGAEAIWYRSRSAADRPRLPKSPWLAYLEGGSPDFPERSLQGDFATIRRQVAAFRADPTTPDTRLADDPLPFNPATTQALTRLMLGGLPTSNQ